MFVFVTDGWHLVKFLMLKFLFLGVIAFGYSAPKIEASGVQGTLAPGRDAFDLFAASFPAGTLVGAPKGTTQLLDGARNQPVHSSAV